ncbi:MAG: N-acetylmuramoyl-L-alanine amidase [Pseudomonadota bacterium]
MNYRARTKTTYLIVHDSHTPPSVVDGETYLRHKGRQIGLLDIGYHILIDRDGKVLICRPGDTMGSHTPGYNDESLGVCLLGGANEEGEPEDNFTQVQKDALKWTIEWLWRKWPEAKVVGHTELARYRKRKLRCPSLDMGALRASLTHPTAA